jgi:hypothetical protein
MKGKGFYFIYFFASQCCWNFCPKNEAKEIEVTIPNLAPEEAFEGQKRDLELQQGVCENEAWLDDPHQVPVAVPRMLAI